MSLINRAIRGWLTFTISAALAGVAQASTGGIEWAMGGQNLSNTRNQADQTKLSPASASRLKIKWTQTVDSDVTATPAVTGGAVYFPDWNGNLYKLDQTTGAIIWKKNIGQYFAGAASKPVSRTSPAVVDGVIYVGGQDGSVLALDAKTGNRLWQTSINPGPFAIVTQAPVVYGGVVYVGAASYEEAAAAFIPNYFCCSSRGSFSALDARTGHILWTTMTVPSGYSGGGVWGSTPAIDAKSKTVYIGTGNNYSVPAQVEDCHLNGTECIDPSDHFDSILALDMSTGAIKWATGPQEKFDAWNVACLAFLFPPGVIPNPGACPPLPGPDYDFAAGPQLLTATDPATGQKSNAVGIGEKSGVYWLLDAATGQVLWMTQVTPGSTLGGIEWGTAADSARIYVAGSDQYGLVQYNVGGHPTNVGSFAALDPGSGKILWQVADPHPSPTVLDLGPVSVSNGVVLAGSMSGYMYAFNATTGALLWSFLGQGSSNAGPAIGMDGTLYWGNGYSNLGSPIGTGSTTFYAFSVDGK
jgi:polyvinyl alcohol dehydrogenase (cytochrome)